jgi:transcriptional regulator with XRE-family HTH domain
MTEPNKPQRAIFDTARLAADLLARVNVRQKDSRISLREAARVSGVSPATLSRVARGRACDMLTFARLCQFLQRPPARYIR